MSIAEQEILKIYDEELRKRMTAEEYAKFSEATAKKAFRKELENLPKGHPLKEVLDDEDVFKAVTGSEQDYWKMMNDQRRFNEAMSEDDENDDDTL